MIHAPPAVRRLVEAGLMTTGLFFCVATSEQEHPTEPEPEGLPWAETDGDALPGMFSSAMWVHNGTDAAQTIRIRSLAPDASIDCDVVATDPGRLLRPVLFGEVQAWELQPDANMPLEDVIEDSTDCAAAIVSVDGMPDMLVFAGSDQAQTLLEVPADGWTGQSGELALREAGANGLTLTDGEAGLVHALDATDPEVAGACAAVDDAQRIAWATPVITGEHRVVSISEGLDRCLDLRLDELASERRQSFVVCLPGEAFPFVAGDAIAVSDAWMQGGRGVRMSSLDDERWLVFGSADTPSIVPEVSAEWEPEPGCGPTVSPQCGTVATAARVRIATGDGWVAAESGTWVDDDTPTGRTRYYVAGAEQRHALRSECAQGTDAIGLDVSMAVAHWGAGWE